MTCLKRSGIGLAIAMAATLLAAPLAWAGRSDDPGAERKAENVGVEEVEKAEAPEKPAEPSAEKKKAVATTPCEERVFDRLFKPWHDRMLYTAVPGGDFETLAEGWTLEGGAALVADSSPFLLGLALGASALELPAGATALSPPICVERGFPNFRFAAKSVSTERASVKVQVVYADGRRKATGRVKPRADWAVTRKLSLAQGRFKVKRGHSAQIQLRFAVTSGTARMDDVYVDPRIWR
jgi:hypothetical protein